MKKRRFSSFSWNDAVDFLGLKQIDLWDLSSVPLKTPSTHFQESFEQIQKSFNLSSSESAKILVIDQVLLEVMREFSQLKIWKEAFLQGTYLTGSADYLIAENQEAIKAPLLGIVEAKKDDFEQGGAQCLLEMSICQEKNQITGRDDMNVYGIVTSANAWQFYRYSSNQQVVRSLLYSEVVLPQILGILHFILNDCEQQIATFSFTIRND